MSLCLSCLMAWLCLPWSGRAAAAEMEPVCVLFSGKKQADAWTSVLTLNEPDTSLLTEANWTRLKWDGTAAPSLVLSSWSGGASWVSVMPCTNVDGAIFYSYADMTAAFGADLSLVDLIGVMNRGAAATVFEMAVVRKDDVLAAESAVRPVSRVVGYLPTWSYEVYQELDFDKLTHLNLAFCTPDESGTLSCDIPDAQLKQIVALAHAHGVSVLASLGGAGGSDLYPKLMETPERRQALNDGILSFCKQYDLDGVDLDIEADVDAVFWETYEDWCLSLRACCDENGYLMTSATACWLSMLASNRALSCFDFLNVMAYDNDGDKSTHSGYDFAVESLEFFRIQRGIPTNRLVLGVPFYGRGYEADGSLSWTSYVPFSELVAKDPDNYNRDSYEGIAYNGAVTMQKKCELANRYGGVMIWELSQDAKGEQSLLSVIGDTVLGARAPLMGDLDENGSVTIADVVLLQRYLLRLQSLRASQLAVADLDENGAVQALDLVLLKQQLLKG